MLLWREADTWMRPLLDGEGREHHSAYHTGRMPSAGDTEESQSELSLKELSGQENTQKSWVLECCGVLRSDWQKGGLGMMRKAL